MPKAKTLNLYVPFTYYSNEYAESPAGALLTLTEETAERIRHLHALVEKEGVDFISQSFDFDALENQPAFVDEDDVEMERFLLSNATTAAFNAARENTNLLMGGIRGCSIHVSKYGWILRCYDKWNGCDFESPSIAIPSLPFGRNSLDWPQTNAA